MKNGKKFARGGHVRKNKVKMSQEEKDKEIAGESVKEQDAVETGEACGTETGETVETTDVVEMSAEESLRAEIEQLKDKHLRTLAEFDNYKKRTLKEKAELIINGSEKAVAAILPVLDDLERAAATQESAPDAEAIREGLSLIFKKLEKALQSLGVSKMDTDGKDFDVDYHEAVAMVPGMGDDKKGKIIDCVQAGYTLNDKVIRHAKVAVGQ